MALNSSVLTMVFRPLRPCLQHQHRTVLVPLSTGTFVAVQTDPVNDMQTTDMLQQCWKTIL